MLDAALRGAALILNQTATNRFGSGVQYAPKDIRLVEYKGSGVNDTSCQTSQLGFPRENGRFDDRPPDPKIHQNPTGVPTHLAKG